MDQNPTQVTATQGTSPPTTAPTNAPPNDAQTPHDAAANTAVQRGINLISAIFNGDYNAVNQEIQTGETHIVSLGLDLVPPTYRAKVQPFVDKLLNAAQSPQVVQITDREIGIGLAIARARLRGFLPFL